MSDKPSKDIDPHIIDQPMLNNPKLALLFTDYQEVLNLFPAESLAAYARKHVDATHDPVTSEKNFYLGLNSDEIKLETIDNTNIDYEKLKTESNINTVDYTQQPDDDVIDSMNKFKLQDVLDVDVQIILYWVEKFRCVHETVKQEVLSVIPRNDQSGKYDNNNTYFNNFNESLFSIRDNNYIKDRSTLSYLKHVEAREPYNKNMMMKLDKKTYNTSKNLSLNCGHLFYKNLANLNFEYDRDARTSWNSGVIQSATRDSWHDDSLTQAVTPDLPHGNNNVTDSIHVTRIESNVDAVQLKMNEILGDMKRVFDFLDKNNSDDIQEWKKWNHSVLKDQVWLQVDQSLSQLKEIFSEKPLTTRKNHDLS